VLAIEEKEARGVPKNLGTTCGWAWDVRRVVYAVMSFGGFLGQILRYLACVNGANGSGNELRHRGYLENFVFADFTL
jgi:hypothetical protein